MERTEKGSVMFTWEEVSWITGIPIMMLLELFSIGLKAKGVQASELPPAIEAQDLANWLRANPGLIREVA